MAIEIKRTCDRCGEELWEKGQCPECLLTFKDRCVLALISGRLANPDNGVPEDYALWAQSLYGIAEALDDERFVHLLDSKER